MPATSRPNILFIVSDQERQRGWLPPEVTLPARQRLIDEGVEFTNHWTHSSPCSPSRATLMTGRYVPQHGVVDNVIHPNHTPLSTEIPTVGKLLRDRAGYQASYVGKWHLDFGPSPDMQAHGYDDWSGNDLHYMGWAGTGAYFDPLITAQAVDWLRTRAPATSRPWFLTVALVNPHDVMWFPMDQDWYQQGHSDEVEQIKSILTAAAWKEGDPIPCFDQPFDAVHERLPENFADSLHDKPDAHRQWRWDQQHGAWGYLDPADTRGWLRYLDYYLKLHQLGDVSLAAILDALDDSGSASDTVVIYTSDHGEMAGSHGLRSKGPFVYNEIMRVPLYVRAPGRTVPGTVTDALSSSVDLVSTIAGLAGLDPAGEPTLSGVDLGPLLDDPARSGRDHVLFAQDSAHTLHIRNTRYALRGVFDGRYKYARYYGFGGGKPNDDFSGRPSEKLYAVDADFDDQDHELYDLQEDPCEMVNLAHDPGRRRQLREHFGRLLDLEAAHFG